MLGRDQFLKLVGALVGHPRIRLARKTPINISGEPVLPKLVTENLADGRWKISVETSGIHGHWWVGSESAWLWSEPNLNPISPGLPAAYLAVLRGPIVLLADQGLNFVQRELLGLSTYFRLGGQTEIGQVVGELTALLVAGQVLEELDHTHLARPSIHAARTQSLFLWGTTSGLY